jgi:predicted metal-dependent peptidase
MDPDAPIIDKSGITPEGTPINWSIIWAVTKITASRQHPFIGGYGYTLKMIMTDRVATAGVDGTTLYWNPRFIAGLDARERVALYIHEVMHCIMLHPFRMGFRNKKLSNIAMDYAIHGLMSKMNMKLPPGALFDEKYDGLPWEVIYERLWEEAETGDGGEDGDKNDPKESDGGGGDGNKGDDKGDADGNGGQKGDGPLDEGGYTGFGDVIAPQGEYEPLPPSEVKKLEEKALQRIEVIKDQVKAIGSDVGSHGEVFQDMVTPEVPWTETLPRLFQAALVPDDINWRRVNKNYEDEDIFMPSVAFTGSGTVFAGVDTSGSCSTAEVQAYLTEIEEITKVVMPQRLVVAGFTTQVQTPYQDLSVGESIDRDYEFRRGGTDVRSIFHTIDEDGINPEVCVIFTDGHTPYPDVPPDYPVIWVMTSNQVAPFGDTIRLNTL